MTILIIIGIVLIISAALYPSFIIAGRTDDKNKNNKK